MSFGDIGRRQDGMSASLSEKSTFTPTQISQQIGALTKRGFQAKEKITELRRRKASQQEKIDLDKELGQLRLDVNSLGAQIDIQKLKLDKLDKAAASSSSASASSGGDTGVQRAAIHKLAKDFERVRANMDVLFTEASLVKVQVGVEGVGAGVGVGAASLGGVGGRGVNEPPPPPPTQITMQQQQMIRLKSVDIDEAIVLERERDIKKLANDLELVHDMYKDMASLVDRQGEHVDKIHISAEQSHEQAKGGLEQVKQAAAYQPGCNIC